MQRTKSAPTVTAKALTPAMREPSRPRSGRASAASARGEKKKKKKGSKKKHGPRPSLSALARRATMVSASSSRAQTDPRLWRKSRDLDAGTRVVLFHNKLGDVRRALERRGWAVNTDRHSRVFDLFWSDSSVDVPWRELEPEQLVNHFPCNDRLTSKIGLLRSLNQLRWIADVDVADFWPRCFDLCSPADVDDFVNDFVATAACAALRASLDPGDVPVPGYVYDAAVTVLDDVLLRAACDDDVVHGGDGRASLPTKVRRARAVLLSPANPLATSRVAKPTVRTPAAAAFVAAAHRSPMVRTSSTSSLATPVSPRRPAGSASPGNRGLVGGIPTVLPDMVVPCELSGAELVAAAAAELRLPLPDAPPTTVARENVAERAETLLAAIAGLPGAQSAIDGRHNVWIVKPGRSSRGRGIECFATLDDIAVYARDPKAHFVVQKYIERPLLIRDRKFDIRQWVLVTSWNPLTVYFYQDAYLRFCRAGFRMGAWDEHDLHLANNAVQKHTMGKYVRDDDFPGNMWDTDRLMAHLRETDGDARRWTHDLQPALKRLVLLSLQAARPDVTWDGHGFELYGYDFMVDDGWRPYLIEVNENPAMEHSTAVTARLCAACIDDMFRIVVDGRRFDGRTNAYGDGGDIGRWERISDDARAQSIRVNAGVDLTVTGQRVQK